MGRMENIRWKMVNPYSIIDEFEKWFAFQKECAFHPEGIPDRLMFTLMGRLYIA